VSSSTLSLSRTSSPAPSAASLQVAAEWYAQLRDRHAAPEVTVKWQQWLNADVEHQRAWSYVEAISQRFEPAYPKEQAALMAASYQKAGSKRIQRRHVLAGFAAFTGVMVVAGIHMPVMRQVRSWAADYATGVGQVRDIRLSDGTHVWMNTATMFNVDYQDTLRRLALIDGEIHITTEKDPRPLVVDNTYGRLRALGTRFTVRQMPGHIVLAVFDGAVEITTTSGIRKTLSRGTQTVFNHDSIGDATAVSDTYEAWTKGVLLAHNMTLGAFVAEMQRYHHGHIGVAGDIADLRVFGSYPLHDQAMTLSMLESVLPVKATHTLPWWTNIVPVPDTSAKQ
jgi:transmembrane sensor